MFALTALGCDDAAKVDGVAAIEVHPTRVGDSLKQNETVVWPELGLTTAFNVAPVPA